MCVCVTNSDFAFHRYFLVYPTPGYGNCFSFNKKDNAMDNDAGDRVSSLPSARFGLSLVLNIDPSAYMINGGTKQV